MSSDLSAEREEGEPWIRKYKNPIWKRVPGKNVLDMFKDQSREARVEGRDMRSERR